jgi:putative toxin-antitoxin system antitoxin component (TIGR02293 family)
MNSRSKLQLRSPGPLPQSAPTVPSLEVEDQAQVSVIRRTVEVIGDQPSAMRWLGTPVRALDYATPISLLHDDKGREAVLTVLGRLKHGVI